MCKRKIIIYNKKVRLLFMISDTQKYLVIFVIGGILLTSIQYSSEFVSPAIASVIGALPVGLFATYFLIKNSNTGDYLKNYIKQTTLTLGLASLYLYGLETFDSNIIYIITIILWIIFSFVRLFYN